jgi:hypothetical protein
MNKNRKLEPQHSVLLMIPAIPGLFFLAFQVWGFYLEGTNAEIDLLFGIYGLVSLWILWMVITGNALNSLSEGSIDDDKE